VGSIDLCEKNFGPVDLANFSISNISGVISSPSPLRKCKCSWFSWSLVCLCLWSHLFLTSGSGKLFDLFILACTKTNSFHFHFLTPTPPSLPTSPTHHPLPHTHTKRSYAFYPYVHHNLTISISSPQPQSLPTSHHLFSSSSRKCAFVFLSLDFLCLLCLCLWPLVSPLLENFDFVFVLVSSFASWPLSL
jgi:hypothetical protein